MLRGTNLLHHVPFKERGGSGSGVRHREEHLRADDDIECSGGTASGCCCCCCSSSSVARVGRFRVDEKYIQPSTFDAAAEGKEGGGGAGEGRKQGE